MSDDELGSSGGDAVDSTDETTAPTAATRQDVPPTRPAAARLVARIGGARPAGSQDRRPS